MKGGGGGVCDAESPVLIRALEMNRNYPYRLFPVGGVADAMPDSVIVSIELDVCHCVCCEHRTLIGVWRVEMADQEP